jgi:UDP-3-O-[3-hydroxymyristoyl] glucosamine N-acyltransferase
MDNLVHIGHDTVIGNNCLFAGQVGIAGATTIEDNVNFGDR